MKRFLSVFLVFILMFSMTVIVNGETVADELINSETSVNLDEVTQEAQNSVLVWFDTLFEFTPEEWRIYIEERVVPWVSLAVTAIAGIYVAIAPILAKIKKTSGIFDGAAGKLDESKAAAEKAKLQLEAAQAQIKSLKRDFVEVKEGYAQMINSLSNIESIVRLGFGNTDELIIKGYANEIEKVGKGNVDNKEKETET